MSEHRATVEWQRSGEFRYETYSRRRAGFTVERYVDEAAGVLDSVKTEVSVEPC